MSTTYLVNEGDYGYGLALVTSLLKRPDTIVIAGVRDRAQIPQYTSFQRGDHSWSCTVIIESIDHATPAAAVRDLRGWGIGKIDVVIVKAYVVSRCMRQHVSLG